MTRFAAAAALSVGLLFVAPAAYAQDGGAEPSVPETIFGHVADGTDFTFENPFTGAAVTLDLPVWKIGNFDISPTRHVVMVWITALVMVIVLSLAARRRSMVPKGFYSLVEVLVNFVREELVHKNIGREKGDLYVPFIATLFFFIFIANLLGMIPYSSTATANISVTAALAIATFAVTLFAGMKEQGVARFWLNIVPQGVPGWLYPIMIPVELLGMVTKPFALTIRLFANLVAGHIVLFFLLALIFLLGNAGLYVAPVSVAFATGMFFLELFVALLQAYIFALLSALFIGMASQPH